MVPKELHIYNLQGGETPPYADKKSHRMRRPKIDENLAERCTDPDSRVPVVNNDGQILTGDDAPLLRELDIWLEEHPTFTPLSEVLLHYHHFGTNTVCVQLCSNASTRGLHEVT